MREGLDYLCLATTLKRNKTQTASIRFCPRDEMITHNSLMNDLPRVIPRGGAAIKQLYKDHCNLSTATIGMFRQALLHLHQTREIEVLTAGGRKKRSDTISDSDMIFPKRQLRIDFCRTKKGPRR